MPILPARRSRCPWRQASTTRRCARVRCRRRRSHRGRARTIRRRQRRARSRFPPRRTFSTRMCSLARAGTRPAARRANGWRRRRRMVSGRRRPIGRPRASRPRSGDLAPRRRRGCSVTSCRPRAHAAIARGRHGHGGKAKSERGPLTASACQRPKSKGGTPPSLPQRAPARSRDLAVFFSILRRYVSLSPLRLRSPLDRADVAALLDCPVSVRGQRSKRSSRNAGGPRSAKGDAMAGISDRRHNDDRVMCVQIYADASSESHMEDFEIAFSRESFSRIIRRCAFRITFRLRGATSATSPRE